MKWKEETECKLDKLKDENEVSDERFSCIFEFEWKKWMDSVVKGASIVAYISDDDIDESIIKIFKKTVLTNNEDLAIAKLESMLLNQRSCSLIMIVDRNAHLFPIKACCESGDVYLATQQTEGYLNKVAKCLHSVGLEFKPFFMLCGRIKC